MTGTGPEMIAGIVKYFDPDKRHGIVVPDGGGPEAVLHAWVVECANVRLLSKGQRVLYEVEMTAAKSL